MALAATETGSRPPPSGIHRLRLGLPEYLIPFAPLAFAPQRQAQPSRPPAPPVFLPVSTHVTAPPGIPPASAVLQPDHLHRPPSVEPRDFTVDAPGRLRALYAQ